VGRGFNALEGDQLAACWYRAGLAKAETEFQQILPGNKRTYPLLHVMDQMKALWRLNDFQAMERRFLLARKFNIALSPEARRAGYLYAEMLYSQQKFVAAADAILLVQREHDQVGDLGVLEKSDFGEMAWVQGLFLQMAGRDAEALPHFRKCTQLDGEHADHALGSASLLSARLGYAQEAHVYLENYIQRRGATRDSLAVAQAVRDELKKRPSR
jgi:hypothetical protein